MFQISLNEDIVIWDQKKYITNPTTYPLWKLYEILDAKFQVLSSLWLEVVAENLGETSLRWLI